MRGGLPVTERSTCACGIEKSGRLIRGKGEPMSIAWILMLLVVLGLFLVNIMAPRD